MSPGFTGELSWQISIRLPSISVRTGVSTADSRVPLTGSVTTNEPLVTSPMGTSDFASVRFAPITQSLHPPTMTASVITR